MLQRLPRNLEHCISEDERIVTHILYREVDEACYLELLFLIVPLEVGHEGINVNARCDPKRHQL